jgi:hypothetical protein
MRNMYPFEPIYSGRRVPVGLNSSQRGPAIIDHRTSRIFKRPDYSDIDLASVCRWLNERHKKYPTPPGMPELATDTAIS